MSKVHAIACQKGGVGKTTITVNLAAMIDKVLGDDEPDVLVVGTDPQRSMDWWANRIGDDIPFAYDQTTDPDILAKLRDLPFAHVFIDTPGSLEDERILRAVLANADDVLVPITPEPLTFAPAETTIRELIEPAGLPYRVVVNAWDPRDGRADLDGTIGYIENQGWPRMNSVIRRYKVHTRAAAEGLVCTQYPANRVSAEARQDIASLAIELINWGTGR